MDKLIHNNREVTITNDGATVLQKLDIVHPSAQTLVDIAMSQDAQVGDGTTSVVLLAAEFLKEALKHLQDGMHARIIARAFRQGLKVAVEHTNTIAEKCEDARNTLEKLASTALNSKLVAANREFFAKMAVEAVFHLDETNDRELIGIKQVNGGSVTESFLVDGVAFKKTFSYAGFEQQPKSFNNPRILILNVELELKAEKENAEVRIKDANKYQQIVEAEWAII